MRAQHPRVHLALRNLLTLRRQLCALQHHRFAVHVRHELRHAVPAVAGVIGMIGVIASARLRRAALKASGDNAVGLTAMQLRRCHSNALQTAATLHVDRKSRHRAVHASLQRHQPRNIAASAHAVARNNIIRLRNLVLVHNLTQHRRPQLLRRNMAVHAVDHAYIAAQAA